jgi:hypothetical protein
MQRALLCASVFLSSVAFGGPAIAGDHPGVRSVKAPPGRTIHHHPVHTPQFPAASTRSATAPIQVIRPAQPTYFLPLPVPHGQPLIYGGVGSERQASLQTAMPYGAAGYDRPARPLSFNPTDPRAVITRLPSGRIAMSPPAGVWPLTQREVAESNRRLRPYAAPSFQLIGDQSPQKAGAAVQLTYGVKPSRRFNPEPQVVFLDERGRLPAASGQVHYLK